MNLGCGIGSCQFLTLGNHREDAADDNGAAGVDLHARGLEDLWEVLGHTLSDAVMLALADGCQVTQTLFRCGVEGLQLLECLFA